MAYLTLAAGDLDGDGQPEFCIGVMTYRMRKAGARMWAQELVGSHLLVLDSTGRVLAQRPLERDVQSLHVAAPSTGVGPNRLLCITSGRLLSFSLSRAS
jgi:hypothetical protein